MLGVALDGVRPARVSRSCDLNCPLGVDAVSIEEESSVPVDAIIQPSGWVGLGCGWHYSKACSRRWGTHLFASWCHSLNSYVAFT